MKTRKARCSGWVVLFASGLLVAGCGDEKTPTPDLVALCGTPFAGAATPVYQGDIRPPVPEYPGAQLIEVITPLSGEHSVETITPTTWSGVRYTRKITSFSTSDNAQVVLSYYRRELTKVGWEESNATPSANEMRFEFSVILTIYDARQSNPCAPTPMNGLPGHGVEVKIVRVDVENTVFEVKETLDPGF